MIGNMNWKRLNNVSLYSNNVFHPINHQNHSISLNHSLPPFIQTIEDSTVRQRLFHRHGKIIEQTKTDLIAVLIHGAEATVHQCQQQFDLEMARLWQQYRHSTSDQRLNKGMVDIIDGRLTNITERFRLISQYQTQYFFAQAPTINHI